MSRHADDDTRTYLRQWDYQHPYMPGKLWKEIRASGAFTEYSYDVSGKVSLVIDPEENDTAYGYDLFDRLVSVTQPGDAVTTYGYDGQGNLSLVTDAEGNGTTYHFYCKKTGPVCGCFPKRHIHMRIKGLIDAPEKTIRLGVAWP